MKKYFEKIFGGGQEEFQKVLSKHLEEEKRLFVVTANPETLMTGQENSEFDRLLMDEETCIVPDGIGTVKAAHMLGYDVAERVTGVEISQFLLKEAVRQGKTVFLLGAKEEVVSALAGKLAAKYPNLGILGYENGYVKDKDVVFDRIAELRPDVVLVALGIPQQELLIYRHLRQFEKGIFVGVGGSFDVLSGTKKRAPEIFIKLNLEWLYRITTEPKRLGRFFRSNIMFILKIRKMK
ncbi:WecB/TagA/CpsF family glycosyltransferase [Ruminococcus sp. CLA-AA-H200]|uniref:WecB/TagA/CpsF family glycosyltransferase n=1 Tax=Ruminococcus turbiniformis TaxID=2881258 RepID=A0ABS8FY87_9FIRM|nr:WecB/TagA/CpsF family glycosyltransferase [Ruminococcus turbiniformis]MCC2254137.1 WecB/TagA/CpsF family glycosyltransferase [Ruminococcus turbiniformis]